MQNPMVRTGMVLGISLISLLCSAQKDLSSVLGEIKSIQSQENISSVVLVITSSKEILHTSYLGRADHQDDQAVDARHYVRIGSVSKMFTGLALMRLVEQGKFSLNTTVSSLVGPVPFTNHWTATHPVRVAHLMEHTAGITDMSGKEFRYKQPLPLKQAFEVDPLSRILRWRPGEHHSYSNSGSGIAAYVIESISNKKFELFVEQEVFTPLKLDSATYFPTTEVNAALITGYDRDGTTIIPYWHTLYRAFGGINIKAVEMANVIQMLMSSGKLDRTQVFPAQAISRMETPRTTLAARSGLRYGYGLGLYHFSHKGFGFIGHGGDADGYLSYLAYSRDLDRGYFVSINAFNNTALNRIKALVNDALIDSAQLPAKPVVAELSKDKILLVQGTYHAITWRFGDEPVSIPLRIIGDNGQLYTIYNKQRRLLIPVNDQHFRRINEPYATIAILKSGNSMILQGDIGNFKKLTD